MEKLKGEIEWGVWWSGGFLVVVQSSDYGEWEAKLETRSGL